MSRTTQKGLTLPVTMQERAPTPISTANYKACKHRSLRKEPNKLSFTVVELQRWSALSGTDQRQVRVRNSRPATTTPLGKHSPSVSPHQFSLKTNRASPLLRKPEEASLRSRGRLFCQCFPTLTFEVGCCLMHTPLIRFALKR